ncbi:hypothetical protein N182_18630 [Sinorhizobium sp. GL2]|nr:hypothetical protein N182_18630 [Sinorhizobium sp. GL2]
MQTIVVYVLVYSGALDVATSTLMHCEYFGLTKAPSLILASLSLIAAFLFFRSVLLAWKAH